MAQFDTTKIFGDLYITGEGKIAGDNILVGNGTTNQIAYFSTTGKVESLTTATYPSLTEISYIKGLTSPVQTQINSKYESTTSRTANTVLAAPNGTAGGATFRALVSADLPGKASSLAANTSTSGVIEANASGTVTTRAIDTTNGGTSASTSLITSGAVYSGLGTKVNKNGDIGIDENLHLGTSNSYNNWTNVYIGAKTGGTYPIVYLSGEESLAEINLPLTVNGTLYVSDQIIAPASTSSLAGLRISSSTVNKTSGLTNGDIWLHNTEGLKLHTSAGTRTLAHTGQIPGVIKTRAHNTSMTSLSTSTVGINTTKTLAAGDLIMAEVNTGDYTYTPTYVTFRLKTNSSTPPNIGNGENSVTFTKWSGSTVYIYSFTVSFSGTSIYLGNRKLLKGTFSSGSIEWTTTDTTAMYIGEIWVLNR